MSRADGAGDARARFFGRVRAAVAGHTEKSPAPAYDDAIAFARTATIAPAGVAAELVAGGVAPAAVNAAASLPDVFGRFRERLESAHGRAFTDVAALAEWLAAQGARHGYCDPTLAPMLAPDFARAAAGPIALETTLDRARIDDYRFGITRAAGAIAETGTIILNDALTSRRLAALAPWIHVAVLSADQIHPHIADAIAALGSDPNVIWCTGPSKTADVEGILIEGVHGPGEQIALVVTAPLPA
jgi:L-lactate dehydrogenase complex protein LldG